MYYEACHPDIYRVGLQPGRVAALADGQVTVPEAERKRFEYMVIGDADTEAGLNAPYDEEETESLLHIEACAGQSISTSGSATLTATRCPGGHLSCWSSKTGASRLRVCEAAPAAGWAGGASSASPQPRRLRVGVP